MEKHIYISVVDYKPELNQQCFICYNGENMPLTVKGGRIDSTVDSVSIYCNSGFTIDTLATCLTKIQNLLQSRISNVKNKNPYINNYKFGEECIITGADIILTYYLI